MNKPINSDELLSNDNGVPLWDEVTEPSQNRLNEMASGPAPQPMGGSEGRSAVFPVEALGKQGSRTVRALCDHIQAPAGLCGQAVLSAMSTTVSSWGKVEAIHGDTMPLSTYSITVAQSGERKTAVDSLVQRGIKAFERKLEHEFGEQRAAHPKSGDFAEKDAERCTGVLVNDPTYEGLLSTMGTGPGFACLSNDDAAGFFGGHAMSRDQRQKTIAGLSQIWSGSDVKRPRAHGKDTVISDIPLTMSLMFQPYLIGDVYGDREMVEQGILPRVLPCFPVSTMGTRFFKETGVDTRQVIEDFGRGVFNKLEQLTAIRNTRTTPTDFFASPAAVLRLSPAARGELIDFYNEVEAQLSRGGKYERIRGFATRSIENATRLAGVISLFDDIQTQEVSLHAAQSARRLMDFYLDEFSFLLNLGKTEKDSSQAGQLGAWMARQYGPNGIGHDKDVSQFAPSAFRKKGDRQAAMASLVDHGWIAMLPTGQVVDGVKRQEAFRVSPRIGEVL
jgi:hypothetical protein